MALIRFCNISEVFRVDPLVFEDRNSKIQCAIG